MLFTGDSRCVDLDRVSNGQEMDTDNGLGVRLPEMGCDAGTEVSSVGGVTFEAELVAHQSVPDRVGGQRFEERGPLG